MSASPTIVTIWEKAQWRLVLRESTVKSKLAMTTTLATLCRMADRYKLGTTFQQN
jgi:hypothetical protein